MADRMRVTWLMAVEGLGRETELPQYSRQWCSPPEPAGTRQKRPATVHAWIAEKRPHLADATGGTYSAPFSPVGWVAGMIPAGPNYTQPSSQRAAGFFFLPLLTVLVG